MLSDSMARGLESRWKLGTGALAVVALAACMAVRPAHAQVDAEPLDSPEPISGPSAGGGSASGTLVGRLLQRVSALEAQNRQIRGELDQLSNSVRRNQATMAKKLDDMRFELSQNGGGAAAPTPAEAPAPTPSKGSAKQLTLKSSGTGAAPAAPAAEGSVGAVRAALLAHSYARALDDAELLVRKASSTPAKAEARYWLGRSEGGVKDYRAAAVAYYDSYKLAPRGVHAPEDLLGVAASMLELGAGKKPAACQALDKLHQEFPAASGSVKAAESKLRRRAGCP
ncbi:hypothetical protein E3E12_05810 [Formicincola oecophyllae]|uniref:Cell division coordinator CpoB n=1 Tax=Formicincola oecophyllae TaxID=2558361 RepID=A0A4Y6U8K3_9PROT|nr:hypothetical protein [Formicincola oecophyllae]QDH13779.1 hypothetical protein E3E12_05810 [Formicincola oecophyllae]